MRGRQVYGPRRVVLGVFCATGDRPVFVTDPAIDYDRLDLAAYRDQYYPEEMARAAVRPGMQPDWFTIAPVSTAQLVEAPPAIKGAELRRAVWLVQCGLHRLEGWKVVGPDGSERVCPQPDRKDQGGLLGQMASAQWVLVDSGLGPHEILALGAMIEFLSTATHPFSRRSAEPPGPGGAAETSGSPTPPTAGAAAASSG